MVNSYDLNDHLDFVREDYVESPETHYPSFTERLYQRPVETPHKHLIVRAEIMNPPGKEDRRQIVEWFQDLIREMGMKIMFGPHAEYCEVVGNRGMTAIAIIETSHIAMHTWDECNPGVMQLDVYTCSELRLEDVFSRLKVFDPLRIEYKFLDRERNLTLLEEHELDCG